LLVGPIVFVYASFQAEVDPLREVGGLGLNPIDFVTPAPGSLVYEGLFEWASARQPTGVAEHGFFLGFLVMGLAVIGLVLFLRSLVRREGAATEDRSRYELGLLGLAGLTSIVLAVGPEALGVTFPFRVLATWIPGYDLIRAASRLAVPGLLAIGIFAAWAVKQVLGRMTSEQKLVVVALVVSLVLVEMWVEPIRAEVTPPGPLRELLAQQPAGAVVELPMRLTADPEFAFVEGPRLLASIGDWRSRFNGYSGGFPPGYFDDVRVLMEFPARSAVGRLQDLGLRYVVLHGGQQPGEGVYSSDQLDMILSALPDGAEATPAGSDWLIDMGPDFADR
jgi:hypothetical protein